MRTRTLWIAGIAAGLLAWFASGELHWAARLLTAMLLGPAPAAFMAQAGVADSYPGPLPRLPLYLGSAFALWLMALVTMAAASYAGFTARLMGLNRMTPAALATWTSFGVLAAASVVVLFKALGVREARIMHELVPVTPAEKAAFVFLSLSAGACEELTFRGFLLPALRFATDSLIAAVVISSLAFGLLHAHQRAGGALRAALIGAIMCVPLIVTGSVYAAMAAHALVDIAGGLWLARWLLR